MQLCAFVLLYNAKILFQYFILQSNEIAQFKGIVHLKDYIQKSSSKHECLSSFGQTEYSEICWVNSH